MNEDILVDKNMKINPDSDIIYSSLVGVGSDDNEIRLILFDKRLISDDNGLKIINESNAQIVLNKETALKLKELLDEHLNK